MTPNTDASSTPDSDRRGYTDIGLLICLVSSLCSWRLLTDYAFPALGQGVAVVHSLILS